MEQIEVSICCTTYNQEKYIAQALDSFLMQKTDFSYEIIIHDDASTDGTLEIIRQYEKRYSNIVVIAQHENQYSKKKDILVEFIYPKVRGKYIAICEGDDYWISDQKLQKQYDFMEKNNDCSICIHGSQKTKDGEIFQIVRPFKYNTKVPTETLIVSGGGFCMTNSFFLRTSKIKDYLSFYDKCNMIDVGISDIVWLLGFSLLGNVYYIDECLSAYRVCSENSWSSKIAKLSPQKRAKGYLRSVKFMDDVNIFTNRKYESAIRYRIKNLEFFAYLVVGNYKEMKNERYREFYNALSFKQKAKTMVKYILKYGSRKEN